MLFRSIDGVQLFRHSDDRAFYLQQFREFLQPVANSFAYALLDNHTHFIIQVKDHKSLLESICSIARQFRTKPMKAMVDYPNDETIVTAIVERQVNSFMSSYTKVTNNATGRKGGLFQSPFRRSLIASEEHLQHSIIYTHANAQKHGLVDDFRKYPFTSYHEILSGNSKYVDAKYVLDFFGGKDKFSAIHKTQADHFYSQTWPELIFEQDQ